MQPQPIDFGASAQGAVASNKEVIVELTSYRPEGAPWQGHGGLVNTGTKDWTRAQREAAAEDPALVRLKKLGLEVGEPKIFLPGMVGGSLELGREGHSQEGPHATRGFCSLSPVWQAPLSLLPYLLPIGNISH